MGTRANDDRIGGPWILLLAAAAVTSLAAGCDLLVTKLGYELSFIDGGARHRDAAADAAAHRRMGRDAAVCALGVGAALLAAARLPRARYTLFGRRAVTPRPRRHRPAAPAAPPGVPPRPRA
jgi:hypothetical protein